MFMFFSAHIIITVLELLGLIATPLFVVTKLALWVKRFNFKINDIYYFKVWQFLISTDRVIDLKNHVYIHDICVMI